ncbi:hypothetical protein A1OE_707 [Candidatus Endolissoclinum faulkneri L2]|uniref:Uncharacterized protein n=1 Tax=Candidatus Endolissoclinum faulkneri L2 TaxID=1193729 RepID=K7YH66_9PROT|nr:hypothetical protein A1OE_707 [Candidatus Endolissoclinum faulkneri L2]
MSSKRYYVHFLAYSYMNLNKINIYLRVLYKLVSGLLTV